jgi:protein phosphatase
MGVLFMDLEKIPSLPETVDLTKPLRVSSHGQTDVGQRRNRNEDQFVIAELGTALKVTQTSLKHPDTQYSRPRGHLFVVADGVGGMAGGQEASALAVAEVDRVIVETIHWCLRLHDGLDHPAAFERALNEADERVRREASRRPELAGMGTTLTLACVCGREAFIAHVGDSRCYLARDGRLLRLTRDHTLVDELVRRGHLRPDEAAQHSLRHVIINVVGGTEAGVRVEVHRVTLRPDDRLLLCSDGLTEMVPDSEIETLLNIDPEPQRACQRLVERANLNGGKDNITAVVARFQDA